MQFATGTSCFGIRPSPWHWTASRPQSTWPHNLIALMQQPSSSFPQSWLNIGLGWIVAGTAAGLAAEPVSSSRFSDQPAPLRLQDFPERPRPLLELGDPFLGPGNIHSGFILPTGAAWNPSFILYGNYRTAVQTFENGAVAPNGNRLAGHRTPEWANR